MDGNERWGLFAGTVATVLGSPFWLLIAWWFSLGYEDYWWETRCIEGQPMFALGQATLAVAGTLTALTASVGTFRAFRKAVRPANRLSWCFGAAGICLIAWVVMLANHPETRACDAVEFEQQATREE
jgi:hypothetical protein